MDVQLDDVAETYRSLAKLPSVAKARIASQETPGHIRVYSEWTQRDLERSEKVKFSRSHIVQLDVSFPTPPTDISNELMNKESPSGRYRAIIRKVKDKQGEDHQYIEVWTDNLKLHNIDVNALDQHGKVYEDGQFGCLEWSYSETHLLYVAEKKLPKAKSYFEKEKPEEGKKGLSLLDTSSSTKGEQFVFREDWGEQLTGKSHPVLCILDVESGIVSTLENIPDDVSPGQAIWCPDDQGVICVGWHHTPYRLGLIYCPIRKTSLFHIDLKTCTCNVLVTDRAIRSPRFSPDHSKLIWLDNDVGGPHMQCARLVMCDWSTKGIVEVVGVVRKNLANEFQGIYTQKLTSRCWSADSKRILISTNCRSKAELFVIDVETGKVKQLTNDSKYGSWTLLDVHRELVIASRSAPNLPEHLVIGQLPSEGHEADIKWTPLDNTPAKLFDITWSIHNIATPADAQNSKFPGLDYEYFILEPKNSNQSGSLPLVVYVHGGPHSVFVPEFALYFSGICLCGFAVLVVNYRGSVGFGQDSIDSLPGNVGTQDVNDVQYAVNKVLESGRFDRDRVVVIGGSHGGFLTVHLIGQFPDFYKAAVCRNPVINVASLFGYTDIPDWCCVESGLAYHQEPKDLGKFYTEMWERSPLKHVDKIKTPVMLMLGELDKRVPYKQGHELRKALQARGIPVRTLQYPDNEHPLSKVDAEADAFVNIIGWFSQYLHCEPTTPAIEITG